MKLKLAVLAFALALPILAQNPACHAQQGAQQSNTSVSTTTATTVATAKNQVNLHVCKVVVSLPEPNTITFQASDGTVLSGPNQQVGSYTVDWDGQLSTVGGGAAAGSNFQIKFGTAPSSAVGVTVIYYTSQ